MLVNTFCSFFKTVYSIFLSNIFFLNNGFNSTGTSINEANLRVDHAEEGEEEGNWERGDQD